MRDDGSTGDHPLFGTLAGYRVQRVPLAALSPAAVEQLRRGSGWAVSTLHSTDRRKPVLRHRNLCRAPVFRGAGDGSQSVVARIPGIVRRDDAARAEIKDGVQTVQLYFNRARIITRRTFPPQHVPQSRPCRPSPTKRRLSPTSLQTSNVRIESDEIVGRSDLFSFDAQKAWRFYWGGLECWRSIVQRLRIIVRSIS